MMYPLKRSLIAPLAVLALIVSSIVPPTAAWAEGTQAKKTQAKAPAKAQAKPKAKAKAPVADANPQKLSIQSSAAIILDQQSGEVLFGKNPGNVVPIASITKLMTAMVVLDANLDPDEPIAVTNEDIDLEKGSRSRLSVGSAVSRDELLLIALMASENRAASALGRSYPGGINAFVQAMNHKAQMLGMRDSRFVDSTGLSSSNVSTAEDLAKMVRAAHAYPRIRGYSTATNYEVNTGHRTLAYRNTNRLVSNEGWHIGLSKTGYISEAGRCLVMQATLKSRPVIIVLLDSWGKLTRIGDANRIRKWLEASHGLALPPKAAQVSLEDAGDQSDQSGG
jgi:D-alanyl-D-alanine endopeptidase (penicillin-binding protein 7)